MNILKGVSILIITLLLSVSVDTALAQNGLSNFAEGLPALKIQSNGDAETTYSLSLQILALMHKMAYQILPKVSPL